MWYFRLFFITISIFAACNLNGMKRVAEQGPIVEKKQKIDIDAIKNQLEKIIFEKYPDYFLPEIERYFTQIKETVLVNIPALQNPMVIKQLLLLSLHPLIEKFLELLQARICPGVESQFIIIIDENGKEIFLPKKIALQANTIKDLYEAAQKGECETGFEGTPTIPIRAISPGLLAFIANFMSARAENEYQPRREFFDNYLKAINASKPGFLPFINEKALINLLEAGNFLDFRLLMEFASYLLVDTFLKNLRYPQHYPTISGFQEDEEELKIAYEKLALEKFSEQLPVHAQEVFLFVAQMVGLEYVNNHEFVLYKYIFQNENMPISLKDVFNYHPEYWKRLAIVATRKQGREYLYLDLNGLLISNLDGINLKFTDEELQRVTWLDLHFNAFAQLDSQLLQKFPQVQILDLSENHLEKIDADSFSNAHELTDLLLTGNDDLRYIDPKAFLNTPRLAVLAIWNLVITPENIQAIKDAVTQAWILLQWSQPRLKPNPKFVESMKKQAPELLVINAPIVPAQLLEQEGEEEEQEEAEEDIEDILEGFEGQL